MNSNKEEFRINLFDLLVVVLKRKRVFFITLLLFIVTGIVASYIIPPKYIATTVLMPPESNSASLFDIPKNFSFGKLGANLLSPQSNLENEYLAILKSRTLQLDLCEKFDLPKIYKLDKKKYMVEDLLKSLQKHYSFHFSDEGTLHISILDRDPSRAADMANYAASKLDEIYKNLTVEAARNRRIFLEERISLVKIDLQKSELALTDFQRKNNMADINSQINATIEAGAKIEAEYLSSVLQLNIDKKLFSPDNDAIKRRELMLKELRKMRNNLNNEKISNVLVPLKIAPDLGLEFIRLKRELKIQELLFELLTQKYEEAKIEESKQTPQVQILDPAIPPEKRHSPKRKKLVMLFTFAGLICSTMLISFQEYLYLLRQDKDKEEKLLTALRYLGVKSS